MQARGVRRVVFVNVNVPRVWEEPNNEVIGEGGDVARTPCSLTGTRRA